MENPIKNSTVASGVAAFIAGTILTLGTTAVVKNATAPEPTSSPVITAMVSPTPTAAFTMDKDILLRKINEQRLEGKSPVLYYDNSLQAFADKRLQEVKAESEKTDRCSHDGFTTSTIATDLKRDISENLVCNTHTEAQAMELWLASPTHKHAMLDSKFSQITIATDGRFAVVLFSTQAYAE